MSRALRSPTRALPSRSLLGPGLLAALASIAFAFGFASAGRASAATYPTGAGSFSGSLEGWKVLDEKCSIGLLGTCSAAGGYDAGNGDPAGSLAVSSDVLVNAAGFFRAEARAESPNFVAVQSGPGTIRLERQFEPGGLLGAGPSVTYSVSLRDATAGTEVKAIEETVAGQSPFTAVAGGVSLVAGHTYAISVSEATAATLALGLTGGSVVRFDNVSLTGPGNNGGGSGTGGTGGGGGGNGGNDGSAGANGLTSSSLGQLIGTEGLLPPAALKGRKLAVKAKCPTKVGRSCRVSIQGMLSKGKPATAVRSAKIAKGKAKRLVLQVKPKSQAKLMKKRKLLFKLTVKAGKAKATVYRRLKLIRH